LGVNHTTVSRRLSALEETVGVRLFDRRPDGYAATQAGEDVVEVARGVEEQILSLDRRVLGQDTRLCGSLRVTTVDFMAILQMAAFRSFTRRYPGIDLELSADNAPRSLTKREADVALRITNKPPEHLVGRKLLRVEFALYGARSLVEQMGAQAELAAYPWMAWDERQGARLTEQWMHKHVPDARVVCRVDSATVMISSVRDGMGLSFLACVVGDEDPGLVRLRPPEPGFGMDLWLLTHADLRHTARVRAFMEHMDEALRPSADRYAGNLD
jgi:DNA-binding transcriptional LysR family regulator